MTAGPVRWSVFTKPWRDLPAAQLVDLVAQLGFDGVELPVRDGFQVTPSTAARDLPALASRFADRGMRIFSVAGTPDERLFAACASAGVPLIRDMLRIGDETYIAAEHRIRTWLDELTPLCERYGVAVGIQPHWGRFVGDATGLRHLLTGHDPRHVGAVWDAAHDALAGQEPEYGLDIIWPHLLMVNLKNAYHVRSEATSESNVDGDAPRWRPFGCRGPDGLADWPRIAHHLTQRRYTGVICLTAEYRLPDPVEGLVASDFAYARSLFPA